MMGSLFQGYIPDPSVDNHDLIPDFLCGPSRNGTHCPPLRSCDLDQMLTADATVNQTCGLAGCFVCLHKDLVPPAMGDWLLISLLAACGILAGAAGIGGGGLNVPILMLVGGFVVEEAVPLSHVAVFGNAIAQNLVNVQKAHPHDSSRPLIDMNLPLLLLPSLIGGNVAGVMVGPSLPPTGVIILACILLLFVTIKTFLKACRSYRQECADAAAAKLHNSEVYNPGRDEPLLPGRNDSCSAPSDCLDPPEAAPAPISLPTTAAEPVVRGTARARRLPPPATRKLLALVVLWISLAGVFVASTLTSQVRSGEGRGTCSLTKVCFLLAQLIVVVAAVGVAATWIQREQRRRDQERLPITPGDLRWTTRRAFSLPCAGALVGVLAGLLGLGGGELIAPLLLGIGMLPQVSAATSACMVLFTSSSDLLHYFATGVLSSSWLASGYVTSTLLTGFASALLGRLLAFRLVRLLSHPSLIAFVLATLLAVACMLLGVQAAREDANFSFAPLRCK